MNLVSIHSGDSPLPPFQDASALTHPTRRLFSSLLHAFFDRAGGREDFFNQLGKQNLSEMLSLSRETDEELFFENVLHFAIRLKSRQEWEKAGIVLNWICRAEDLGFRKIPEGLRVKAREELQAMVGEGSVGMRLEFLLSRFAKEAIDYRMILPMMAGTVVSTWTSARAFAYFSSASTAASRLPSWSPSLFAAATGFAAEVPTFVLAGRLLSAADPASPKDSLLEDLGTVGTSLGLMKLFGVAGGSLARRTNGRFLPFAIPQASMFLGLAAAHRLEEKMGLRPPSADRGIFFVDTLSAWLSLNVGASLGRRLFQDRALRFRPTGEFPQGFRSLTEKARNFLSSPIKVAMTPEGIPLPLFMVEGSGGKKGGSIPQSDIQFHATGILNVLISSPDPQIKIRALRRIPSLAQNASQAHQMLLLKSILKGIDDPHPKVRTAALRYFEASRWSFPKDDLFFIVMELIPEMGIILENESAVRGLEMLLGVSRRPTAPVPETVSLPEEKPPLAKKYVLHLTSPLEASPALWEQEVAIELKVGEAFTLGRAQGPFEIEPHQRDVSRAHLTLIRKTDGLYVVDGSDPMLPTYRHSMTGVSFNGIRLRSKKTPLGFVPQEAMIRPGDTIEFARGFILEIKDPVASSPQGGPPALTPEKKSDTLRSVPHPVLRPQKLPSPHFDISPPSLRRGGEVPPHLIGISPEAREALVDYEKLRGAPLADELLHALRLKVSEAPDHQSQVLRFALETAGRVFPLETSKRGALKNSPLIIITGDIVGIGRNNLYLEGFMGEGQEKRRVVLHVPTHGFDPWEKRMERFRNKKFLLQFSLSQEIGGITYMGNKFFPLHPAHARALGVPAQNEIPVLITNEIKGLPVKDFSVDCSHLSAEKRFLVAHHIMRDLAKVSSEGHRPFQPHFLLGDGVEYPWVQWAGLSRWSLGMSPANQLEWIEVYQKALMDLNVPSEIWIREPWKVMRLFF